MERDAFKIPLRPNPSTLPNVLPTILHAPRPGLQNKQKSFSFIPFQESTSHLINTHHVPGDGRVLLLGRRGQAEWFSSLLTQLSREWIKGSARAWTQVPLLSPCPAKKATTKICNSLLIMYSSSCTYAGMHCSVFYPQRECSWRPWTSGYKPRNDLLLHKSDSTCIQNSEILRQPHKTTGWFYLIPFEITFPKKHILNYFFFIHLLLFFS